MPCTQIRSKGCVRDERAHTRGGDGSALAADKYLLGSRLKRKSKHESMAHFVPGVQAASEAEGAFIRNIVLGILYRCRRSLQLSEADIQRANVVCEGWGWHSLALQVRGGGVDAPGLGRSEHSYDAAESSGVPFEATGPLVTTVHTNDAYEMDRLREMPSSDFLLSAHTSGPWTLTPSEDLDSDNSASLDASAPGSAVLPSSVSRRRPSSLYVLANTAVILGTEFLAMWSQLTSIGGMEDQETYTGDCLWAVLAHAWIICTSSWFPMWRYSRSVMVMTVMFMWFLAWQGFIARRAVDTGADMDTLARFSRHSNTVFSFTFQNNGVLRVLAAHAFCIAAAFDHFARVFAFEDNCGILDHITEIRSANTINAASDNVSARGDNCEPNDDAGIHGGGAGALPASYREEIAKKADSLWTLVNPAAGSNTVTKRTLAVHTLLSSGDRDAGRNIVCELIAYVLASSRQASAMTGGSRQFRGTQGRHQRDSVRDQSRHRNAEHPGSITTSIAMLASSIGICLASSWVTSQ